MKRKSILIALAAFCLGAVSAMAQDNRDEIRITHGPYLQDVRETEATIVWVSNMPCMGWVEMQEEDGNHFYKSPRERHYDTHIGIKNETRVHSVRLTGLKPGTEYRYRVYSQEIISHEGARIIYGDVNATRAYQTDLPKFRTCDPGKETVRFVMVNDIHGKNDVLGNLLDACDAKASDMVLFVGDMASSCNKEDQIFGDFMDTAVEKFAQSIPMYYTRGNHETRGSLAAHFQDYFSPKADHLYYMYRQGPVCFVALDCGEDKPDSDIEYYGANSYDEYRSEQAAWLEKVVRSDEFKNAPFRVITCHMPPGEVWGDGWHGGTEISEKFMPILNRSGADIMLCGHLHALKTFKSGELASFPLISNAANTAVVGEISRNLMKIKIVDESGKTVYSTEIRK